MSGASARRGRFAGARVLVTGGASGIGRLMALGAAARGARVTVWDLDGERAEQVRDRIRSLGGTAEAAGVDVTDRARIRAAAEAAGPVDILINDAGVVTGKPLLECSDEAIERTFAVNTLSQFWVTRAFLPGMLARDRGTVVTIASAAGLVGVARQTDYSASKFAAFGFSESLRAELRKRGSRVSTLVVCPFYIDTGMFAGVRTRFPHLLPILREDAVARAVLDAIARGRRQLIMPPFVRMLPLVRMLPATAFDRVVDFFGVNETMDRFIGRVGARRSRPARAANVAPPDKAEGAPTPDA